MGDLVNIPGKLRLEKGKGSCRKIRAKGELPGNIIDKVKSTPISLDPKWLSVAWKGGKTFNLELDGQSKHVKIQELQVDPVTRKPLHVDLMYV